MSVLTTVMYHYVRPIAQSDFPGIKGLELSDFKKQLDYIDRHYSVISIKDLFAFKKEGKALPENPALLTFDDGYRDHKDFVFPELVKRKWSGVFFPPADAVENREMLDVNKIHYFMAKAKNVNAVVEFIEAGIFSKISTADSMIKELRAKCFMPNRYDPAEVNYIKRLLQFALPQALRSNLADQLFRKYVSEDPKDFAEKVYLNSNDLIEMIDAGMYVGSHGCRHFWLDQLSEEDQQKDIERSLEFLSRLGLSKQDFLFCYPYGAFNDDTLKVLKRLECGFGFTTVARNLSLESDINFLTIPRLDTNDLPKNSM